MADSEEYELLPRKKVQALRSEIESLKRTPLESPSSNKELVMSIDRFTRSVDRLYALFENVQREVLEEYQKGEKPEDKLDKVIEQNKHLAEGIIAITESLSHAPDEELINDAKQEDIGQKVPEKQNQQGSPDLEWTNKNEFGEEPPVLRQQQYEQSQEMPARQPNQQQTTQAVPPRPQQDIQQRPEQATQEIPPRFEVPKPPEEEPQRGGLPELPNIGQHEGQEKSPWMDSQNPFRQQMEVPSVKANYPSPMDYPSVQGEPQLTKPLHAEPEKKKRYLGFF